MQSDELFGRLETACRDAGGYVIHSKDALARQLALSERDREGLTAKLKELSEQGKVVVERRGRAGLLIALPGVPLPERQRDRVRKRRLTAGRAAGRAAGKRDRSSGGAVRGAEPGRGADRRRKASARSGEPDRHGRADDVGDAHRDDGAKAAPQTPPRRRSSQDSQSAHKGRANAGEASAPSCFCPWCGSPIALAWNYCSNCGDPLDTVKDLYASCKIM